MNEDKASRYHRLKRRVSIVSFLWTLVVLVALLVLDIGASLRSAAESLSESPTLTVCLYVILMSVITEAGALPLAFYSGFLLERRYGLSTERAGAWLLDQAKAFAISLVLACGGAAIVYFFIRRSPDGWWLPAGIVFALLIVVMANLAPVVVLPLFYSVKPLERESLRTRLLALAERAGARVVGTYEWGLGDKTRKANAALTGLGGTRRILVSDTMLAAYSEDEIEVVLAHELAHHVHGDIWKGIAFESALMVGGLWLAARVLAGLAPRFGINGPADVAGLPLLLLAAGAVSLVMVPVAHAMSRAYERAADRFALHLTKNPGAFISAMKRLGAQNLAEDDPSRVVQWLFYSHPPVRERIAAAQAFARE
jgi:STE24 endopeptidase